MASKTEGEEALHSEMWAMHQEREQLQQNCAAYEQRCRQLEEEAKGHMTIPSAKQEADAEARKQFLALQEELSAVRKSLQVWPCVGSRASEPLIPPFAIFRNWVGPSLIAIHPRPLPLHPVLDHCLITRWSLDSVFGQGRRCATRGGGGG